jgi:hypothetical protein
MAHTLSAICILCMSLECSSTSRRKLAFLRSFSCRAARSHDSLLRCFGDLLSGAPFTEKALYFDRQLV